MYVLAVFGVGARIIRGAHRFEDSEGPQAEWGVGRPESRRTKRRSAREQVRQDVDRHQLAAGSDPGEAAIVEYMGRVAQRIIDGDIEL